MDNRLDWPQQGMNLFETTDQTDWRTNAQMAHGPCWVVYEHGYELAAKLLLERAGSGRDQDFLIYPILFNARQAIELGLKELMLLGERLSLCQPYPKCHDLVRLWKDAKKVLLDAGSIQDDEMRVFETLVQQLANADPGSMTFRYPVDKADRPSFCAYDGNVPSLINTRDLNRVLNAMFNYLGGVRDWLEDVVDTEETALQDLSAGDQW